MFGGSAAKLYNHQLAGSPAESGRCRAQGVRPLVAASERRVALIQPATSYIGPALARRLAQLGHDLVVLRPRPGLLDELIALGVNVEVIGEDAVPARGPGSDATAEGCQRIVDQTLQRFGRLDAAALTPSTGADIQHSIGRMMDTPVEAIAAMSGYLVTTCHALRAVIPAMRSHGGQVVVFTSDAGARPEVNWAMYGAARAGQQFLVRATALEHAHEQICINAVGSKNAAFDGFLDLPPGAATDSAVQSGPWSARYEAETPLGRMGTMDELAAFASVLLDGTNRFQTAHYFSFSGGWHAL